MIRFFVSVLSMAGLCCGGTLAVRLFATASSPQPVGVAVGLTPRLENPAAGMHVFRYSASVSGGPFRIIRDFSQQADFVWAPALYEHEARVRVTVRNNGTKDTAEAELPFRIVSRVKDSQEIVTPTSHPLIALFSAPPCGEGSQFRVAFRRSGDETATQTPLQPCQAGRSNNAYVAGMSADSEYRMRAEVVRGSSVQSGRWLVHHTGLLDGDFPPVSVPVPRASGSTASDPVLIHSVSGRGAPKRAFATDLDGNIIWYLPAAGTLNRILPGGRMLIQAEGMNSVNAMRRSQILREVDVAGNTLRETNIGRVAEQLTRYGIQSDCRKGGAECVPGFHHESIRLPNGHTLVLAGLERMFPTGTQGPKGPVDILGDIVIELDEEFQVASMWNSFDALDIKRGALGDGKCREGAGGGGCTPVFLAAEANEWLHSNSLNYIPSTGDFLISMPEQNWVAKIDWRNGKGSGKLLWRLGEGGDFKAVSDDPHPWFSFQHDAGFEPAGSNLLTLLDDGHERLKKDPKANNRGQAWKLDEENRTATLVLNADLGVYAVAVGSAQTLKNGGYSFEAGFINPASVYSRAVETSADGKVVYAQQLEGQIEYRSFRVADLYSGTVK